jgi:hypothetical protein
MKIRSTREGLAALRTGTAVTSIWLAALLGLGTAAALLAAPLAGAQEPQELAQAAPAEPDATAPEPPAEPKPTTHSGMEEIVVRGAESQAAGDFEAADSVTGFGAEDLAALGAQDIADLASFTPNLEIVTSGATTPTFFIRGVGLNDFNANSTGAVAIYQDDVAINAPALQLSTLFDIEAVNVLRGPQGTGLARNASRASPRASSGPTCAPSSATTTPATSRAPSRPPSTRTSWRAASPSASPSGTAPCRTAARTLLRSAAGRPYRPGRSCERWTRGSTTLPGRSAVRTWL